MIERTLRAVEASTGLEIDQLRYVFLLLLSFPLGHILRVVLHPRRASPTLRHLYNVVLGVGFAMVCFGWQTSYLVGMTAAGYVLLLVLPPQTVQRYSTVFVIMCTTASHLYRMITDYGGYHLDFTGPLMIIVQRVTYVAFALHDGLGRKEEDLTVEQKSLRLKRIPSVLEYFSYNLSFLTLLAGPTAAFKEYQDFITGDNYKCSEESSSCQQHPSPLLPATKKFMFAMIFAVQFLFLSSIFTEDWLLDPNISFPLRVCLTLVCVYKIYCRYFYGWFKTESICNTAGLGFQGYNEQGQPQWDLVKNIDITGVLFGTNFRHMTLSWHICTQTWLRRVCYERVSFMPLLTTWAFSALWHGLYPGYYLCFGTLSLTSMAGRKVRRLFRHRFQSPPRIKLAYDIVTWLGASLSRDFAAVAWLLLRVDLTFQIWRSLYFAPLIVLLLIIAVVPDPKKEKATPSTSSHSEGVKQE